MKAYPAYKDSGVEWIGGIPEHWDRTKFKFYYNSRMGQTILNENLDENGDIPVYSATEEDKIFGYIKRENANFILMKGDFVIPARGVSIGNVKFVRQDSICTQTTICSRKLTNTFDQSFVFHYLIGLKQIHFQYDRTAIPQITVDQVDNLFLFKPLYIEQQAIANYLDRQTQKLDRLIALKEKKIELLKEYRAALINQAVTKGLNPHVKMKDSGIEWLGQIPEHWEFKKLKYLVNLINKKCEDTNKIQFRVCLENIEGFSGKLIESEQKFEGIGNSFNKGDVLFSKLRPYLCKAILASENGVAVSELLILRCGVLILNKFLLYFILSKNFISEVNSSTYGVQMPRANWDFIGNLKFAVADIMEQQSIVKYLDQKTQELDKNIENAQAQITQLKEYRTALISAAVTGKIDVRDEV